MNEQLRRRYFLVRRINTVLGVVPVGAFFFMHMALNSRAGQGREQYQWVPDTLDQLPFLLFIEIFGILLPIAAHAALGVWIALRADLGVAPALKGTYNHFAYVFQRVSGYILLVAIAVHVYQTWWQHKLVQMGGEHYDIYGSMNTLLRSPAWLIAYALFVLIAAWHFANGIFNFAFKTGLTTSVGSQRFAMALGFAVGAVCVILGFTSLWGLAFSPWSD